MPEPLAIYRSIIALAESIIRLYKTELIKSRKPWKGFEDLEIATAEWVSMAKSRSPLVANRSPHPA